jgi:DUF1680 family protein
MYKLHDDATYFDTMEQALYNTVLAGISLSGREFFYVNPLETHPKYMYQNPDLRHVKTSRQPWFACACCPPNLARTVLSLSNYAIDATDDCITLKLFISGEYQEGSKKVRISTSYPYTQGVKIEATGGRFKLRLRSPGHAPLVEVKLNGESMPITLEKGWLTFERDWQGDSIELTLNVAPKLVYPHPKARHLHGRCAVVAGPLVYCAEGDEIGWHMLKQDTEFTLVEKPTGLPQECIAYGVKALKLQSVDECLYSYEPPHFEEASVVLIPYHLWGNRGFDEMTVFFMVKQ